MAPIKKGRNPAGDESTPFGGDADYEECPVCHQEFTGVCPITSADCPYLEKETGEEEEEEEGEQDFEDVADLNKVLDDDAEADRVIEEEEEIPPEDLEEER